MEQNTYIDLLNKYNKLLEQYETLKVDFSENTIIQSMNDMKHIYQTQKETQKKLIDIIDSMSDSNNAVKIMMDTLISSRFTIDNHTTKTRLEFINEILKNNIKKRIETYYLQYGDGDE